MRKFIIDYNKHLVTSKGFIKAESYLATLNDKNMEDLVVETLKTKLKVERVKSSKEKILLIKRMIEFMKDEFYHLLMQGGEIGDMVKMNYVLSKNESEIYECAKDCASVITLMNELRLRMKLKKKMKKMLEVQCFGEEVALNL